MLLVVVVVVMVLLFTLLQLLVLGYWTFLELLLAGGHVGEDAKD